MLSYNSKQKNMSYCGCVDRDKDTPLLYTVHNGDLDGCRLLVNNGADCLVRDRADVTVTWTAAYSGHYDVLRYLILCGNPPLSTPSRGLVYHYHGQHPPFIYNTAYTPLCVAIRRKHYAIAELLLDAGVMMSEEQWCWNSSWVSEMLAEPSSQMTSLRCRLTEAMSEVPSLLQIVRHCLRRQFGQRILLIVPQLDIPRTLKDYLLLRSLENCGRALQPLN